MGTTVRYWEKWRGDELSAVERIVAAFNVQQDRYRVVIEEAGDRFSSTDIDRLAAAVARGDPPDIVGVENRDLAALADAGRIEPLEEVVEVDVGHLREPALAACTYGDRLYGLPVSTNLGVLFVDDRSLGDTAVSDAIPRDIREFTREVLEGPIRFVPTYPGWWPHLWAWAFGGGWYEGSRFTPARQANVEALDWLARFRALPWSRGHGATNPIPPDVDPFEAAGVDLIADGEHLVHRLAGRRRPWSLAPLPSTSGEGMVYLEVDALAVPRGAQATEGIGRFFKWMIDADRLESLAMRHGKSVPTKAWSADFLASHPNPHLRTLEEIVDAADLRFDPRQPTWPRDHGRITDAVERIWSDGADPATVLGSIADEAKRE